MGFLTRAIAWFAERGVCVERVLTDNGSGYLMTRIDRPAGQVLTTEGEPGSEFFIVLEGEVEVRQGDRVIATRRPGDYVGEIALLDKRPRTATVVATTPVSVEVLSRRELLSLLAEVPELSERIMATMAERLADLEANPTG